MSGGAHIPHGHGQGEHEKRIGLTIAVLAVVMAIVSALAKDAANAKIVSEVKASNQYAWYQSKRIRVHVNDLTIKQADIALLGQPNEAQRAALEKLKGGLKKKNEEYEGENKQILDDADHLKREAAFEGEKYEAYDHAEIFLQIAVVLCSVTLLTGRRGFQYVAIVLSLIGVLLAGRAYWMRPHTAPASAHDAPAPTPAPTSHGGH